MHVSTTNRTAINSSYTNDSLCLILRNAQIELCFPSLAIFIRSVPKAKIQEEDRELKKNKVQFFDSKRKRNQNKNETIKNNIHTNTNTRERERDESHFRDDLSLCRRKEKNQTIPQMLGAV